MTKEQHLVKAALDLEAAWGRVGFDLFLEIVKFKQLCGQARFCLAGPCQGIPDAASLLCDELGKASEGVEIPALPEPTAEWVAEYGRRILEHQPSAVFIGGKWMVSE